MKTLTTIIVALAPFTLHAYAQTPTMDQAIAWVEFQRVNGDDSQVDWGAAADYPVSVLPGKSARRYALGSEQAAAEFLMAHGGIFGLRHGTDDLRLVNHQIHRGITHLRYQQHHIEVPIEEAYVGIHLDSDGRLVFASGKYYSDIKVDARPAISAEAAVSSILARSGRSGTFFGESAKLILRSTGGSLSLAWIVRFTGDSSNLQQEYVVDATTGEIVEERPIVCGASGLANVYPTHPHMSTVKNGATLPRLVGNGYLDGAYVKVQNDGGANAYSANHDFRRSVGHPWFEQANVYYHVDRMASQFFTPLQAPLNPIVAHVNAAVQGNAEAYAIASASRIYFTDGTAFSRQVSPALEDKVIYHEYSHVIAGRVNNAFTNTGTGELGSMTEGLADYFAGAFADRPKIQDFHEPTSMRDMSVPRFASYSEYQAASTDKRYGGASFFSAILWDLRRHPAISPGVVDRMVFYAIYFFSTGGFDSFRIAMKAADNVAFGGSNNQLIDAVFAARGVGSSGSVTIVGGAGVTLTYSSDHNVAAGTTLVILPGTVVRFASQKRLNVYGTLMVDGATFTASGASWSGIYFRPGGGGTIIRSRVEKTTFQGAVTVDNAVVEIAKSIIRSNVPLSSYYGVWVRGANAVAHIHDNIDAVDVMNPALFGRSFGILYEVGARGTSYNNVIGTDPADVVSDYAIHPRYGAQADMSAKSEGFDGQYLNNGLVSYGGVRVWNNAVLYGGMVSESHRGGNDFCTGGGYYAQVTDNSTAWLGLNAWYESPPNPAKIHVDATSFANVSGSYVSLCSGASKNVSSMPMGSSNISLGIALAPDVDEQIREAVASTLREYDEERTSQALRVLGDIVDGTESGATACTALKEIGYLAVRTLDAGAIDLLESKRLGGPDAKICVLPGLMFVYTRLGDFGRALAASVDLKNVSAARWDKALATMAAVEVYRLMGDLQAARKELESVVPVDQEEAEAVAAAWTILDETGGREWAIDPWNKKELAEPVLVQAHAFPNPFNPSTTISFEIPEAMNVELVIYDVVGRAVQVLASGMREEGHHTETFDGTRLSTGIYLYKLTAGGHVATGTVLLLK